MILWGPPPTYALGSSHPPTVVGPNPLAYVHLHHKSCGRQLLARNSSSYWELQKDCFLFLSSASVADSQIYSDSLSDYLRLAFTLEVSHYPFLSFFLLFLWSFPNFSDILWDVLVFVVSPLF